MEFSTQCMQQNARQEKKKKQQKTRDETAAAQNATSASEVVKPDFLFGRLVVFFIFLLLSQLLLPFALCLRFDIEMKNQFLIEHKLLLFFFIYPYPVLFHIFARTLVSYALLLVLLVVRLPSHSIERCHLFTRRCGGVAVLLSSSSSYSFTYTCPAAGDNNFASICVLTFQLCSLMIY